MSLFAVSLHIDRPDAALNRQAGGLVRVPPQADWSAALQEVTARTAAPFASAILGLHDSVRGSEYFHYTAIAHRRHPGGGMITPANPADALYQPGTLAAQDDILARHVRAEVTQLQPGEARADDHIHLNISAAAHAQMRAAVALTAINPPAYHLVQQNCLTFGRQILRAGGVSLPPVPDNVAAGPRRLRVPQHLSVALQAMQDAGTPVDGAIAVNRPRLLLPYTF